MKILMLSWRDPKHPLAGGAEQVMHEHAKGWIKGGHSVTLFSSRFKGSSKEEVIDGVEILRGGSKNFLGVQIAAFFYYLKNHSKYDFLVDMFHGYPFFTPLYSKKPKLAVIQETAREVWFLNPLFWPLNWIVGMIGFNTEPLVFQLYKSTQFMTGSQSAKVDVTRMGISQENITVVPHGVILKKLKKKVEKEKKFTLVYLGILSKDKGIEDALKCFSLLRKNNFQFWVIGRPETPQYSETVKRVVEDLELNGKVKFWGYVSQTKKFELLAKAHLLINPSIREGWGLVNIEANAVGLPVVAYNSQGLVDSVKDGESGIIIQENTPEALAKNITDLRESKSKYQSLVEGSVNWSQKFSWKESGRMSLQLIEKIYKQN